MLHHATRSGLLLLVLAGLVALAAARTAAAEAAGGPLSLRVGVYAAGPAAARAWLCGATVAAMEDAVAERLGRPVRIAVTVSDDYRAGADAVLRGETDLARVPRVRGGWVASARLADPVALAWVESLAAVHPERPVLAGGDAPCAGPVRVSATRLAAP